MADNRSLDEFTGGDSATADVVEPVAEGAEPDDATVAEHDPPPADATADSEPIDPMAETFAWSAAAGECASCGEAVEERWRDGDALVCGGCKAW